MCIERRFSEKNGFRRANCFCCLSQNAMVCHAHCRQELQQKSWKLHDFFFKTKTKCSRLRLSFLSSRRLDTMTLVSRTTSLCKTNPSTLIQAVVNRDCWEKSQNHKEAGSPKRLRVSTGDCWSWPDWPCPHILRQIYATGVLCVRGLTIGTVRSFSSQRQWRKSHKTPWWCTASVYAEVMHCWEVLR